jgi:hypothetical protein
MHFSPPLLRFDSEDWPVIFGNPEVMPRMDSQRCCPEVGFVEVKSLFTFYPREHRSAVRSYGL